VSIDVRACHPNGLPAYSSRSVGPAAPVAVGRTVVCVLHKIRMLMFVFIFQGCMIPISSKCTLPAYACLDDDLLMHLF
jgi:hypothetical protein